MNTLSRKYIWTFFSILIAVMVIAYVFNVVYSPQRKPDYSTQSSSSAEKCITVRDLDGNIIFQTGEPVTTDDEFISANDVHYIVTQVEGSEGLAEIKSTDDKPVSAIPNHMQIFSTPQERAQLFENNAIPAAAPLQNTHVVIYHTHTDESYIPTSGTASEPANGDIFVVGKMLQQALQQEGVSVTHSYNTHDPHDVNAYHRSRRTVTQLLKEQPDAAFDIHRDSAPAKSYLTSINGIYSSRVMIVIGRSNPNMQTNLDYARAIKASADQVHPGLMRGIFIGRGDYNQDLYPTAILFEVGTDQLSEYRSELAVHHLCDAIIRVLANK